MDAIGQGNLQIYITFSRCMRPDIYDSVQGNRDQFGTPAEPQRATLGRKGRPIRADVTEEAHAEVRGDRQGWTDKGGVS